MVSNKDDGLLGNTYCLFIGDSLDSVFDSFCPGFLNDFYVVSKIFILLDFGIFFVTFFIWFTA